jgi:hypothetical protein
MSRRYSEEQRAWLNAYIPDHHHADTAKAFTEKWPDMPMTEGTVKAYSHNHHIPCGRRFDGHPSKYPKGVRDFIQTNYKDRGNKELYQMLCDRFGPVMTYPCMKAYKKNHNLSSGLDGRFEKGHVPTNKGKTWDDFMSKEGQRQSRKTCFAAGHVPHNHLPVGTVVKTTDGYMARKIKEPNKWEYIHRATWEKHNGPIPEGLCVTFKDGNTENCDIDNLMLISRAENAKLNQQHLRYEEPELTETGLLIAKVLTAAGERKHRRKKKHDHNHTEKDNACRQDPKHERQRAQ